MKSAKDSAPKTAPELCARLLSGEIAVFDKAYVDFKHLNLLNGRGIFYVTRKKENMLYEVMGQHTIPSREDGHGKMQKVMGQHRKNTIKTTAMKRKYTRKKIRIIGDERIRLPGVKTAKHYPQELRLVTAEVEVKKKNDQNGVHHEQL